MINFIKTYWKTLLFFTAIGIVGGFFTGLYVLDTYPAEMRQELLAQGMTNVMLGAVTAVQAAAYGLVLGALGILLAKNVGLWRDERTFTKKPLIAAAAVSVIGGLAIILPDIFFFGKYSDVIASSYAAKPTIPFILASVTYGAVIEEVMLRLFMMSLIAFVLHKLCGRKNNTPTSWVFTAANIISALLFAAGHLPTTLLTIGSSPIIIARCFILNGGIGLLFGLLYRKYGLRYAMIAHGGCHIVSKLIWILFL